MRAHVDGEGNRNNAFDGTAIVSRVRPIECTQRNFDYRWPFSLHSFSACRYDKFVFINVHPALTPRSYLKEQADQMAGWINEFAGQQPVIVTGDFNNNVFSDNLASLRTVANLTDVFNLKRDPAFKYPGTRGDNSIDHIFFRGFSQVVSAAVLPTDGMSDHRCVEARLKL
eukprot:TRINITY_DN66720_c5_g1_i2.p1 TRINITY_DN66720_c5_g1~~TRINITY_DN66720_c5_g1_i2.p1  ORF type:complete len:170 (-),score=80.98 TRINITY_DN66720_c5_g1_i2:74-583(-)